MHLPRLYALLLSFGPLCLVGCAPPAELNLPDLKDMRNQPVPPMSIAEKRRDIAELQQDAQDMWAYQAETGLTAPAGNAALLTLDAHIHREGA